jgi:hypothetical protein
VCVCVCVMCLCECGIQKNNKKAGYLCVHCSMSIIDHVCARDFIAGTIKSARMIL